MSTTPYSVAGHPEAHATPGFKVEPPRQSVHESDGQTSQLTALQGSTASQCPRRRTRSSGTQRRTPPHRPRWSRRCSRRTCRMHGRRSSRRCKHGARWPGGPPLQVQACELGGRPVAASCRAASPAAPSPPPARLAAWQRSIPRRPRPPRVELRHRQLHRRRLPASHQSSGRSHDARGRVVSSCVTGSSIAAACSPRSRAAVDPTTPTAASCRAASPAAPSPPSACFAAEQRSIPRRTWPRRVELHHQQLRRRRLLASHRSRGRSLTPTAATCRAASPAAPSPPPARLAAGQRSIPRRPWPHRDELHHRQLHRRRLPASRQSSGRSPDVHGRVASSCITGSSTTAACSPRSRAAVDPAAPPGRLVSSCITGSSIAAACSPRSRAAVDPTTPLAASRRAAPPAAPSPSPARLAAEQRSIPRRSRPCSSRRHGAGRRRARS